MNPHFVEKLIQNNIRFLLIGGRAMNLLGSSRKTKDYDLLIQVNTTNVEALYKIIIDMLGYVPNFQYHELLGLKKKLPLPGDIDVLTSIDGVNFDDFYKRSNTVMLSGAKVNYPCVKDMLTLKNISAKDKNRTVDNEDISFLEGLCA